MRMLQEEYLDLSVDRQAGAHTTLSEQSSTPGRVMGAEVKASMGYIVNIAEMS